MESIRAEAEKTLAEKDRLLESIRAEVQNQLKETQENPNSLQDNHETP